MKRFWISWCVVAAALCGAIWFGLPAMRESAPDAYRGLAGLFGITPAAPVSPVAPVAPAAPVSPVAPVASVAPVAKVAPVTPAAPVAPVAKVAPVASVAPVAPVAKAAPVTPEEPQLPPSPAPNWGVVSSAKTDTFDSTGAKRGTIQAGSAVAWTRRSTLPSQPGKTFAECFLLRNGEWHPAAFFVATSDLVLFEGVAYEETNPAQRDAAMEYFTLLGRYETLRAAAEARAAAERQNPYEAEYRAAKAKFDEIQTEVNAIMERVRWSDTHDLPGGIRERGQLLQRAQALRPVQNEARRAFNPIREKWEAWEAQHPNSGSNAPVSTPDMRLLEKELARLRPEVAKFVPGL